MENFEMESVNKCWFQSRAKTGEGVIKNIFVTKKFSFDDFCIIHLIYEKYC